MRNKVLHIYISIVCHTCLLFLDPTSTTTHLNLEEVGEELFADDDDLDPDELKELEAELESGLAVEGI